MILRSGGTCFHLSAEPAPSHNAILSEATPTAWHYSLSFRRVAFCGRRSGVGWQGREGRQTIVRIVLRIVGNIFLDVFPNFVPIPELVIGNFFFFFLGQGWLPGGDGLPGLARLAGSGVFRDFFDHAVGARAEVNLACVFRRHVKGAENELGAAVVDGVADEGIDDLHERGLDGCGIVEDGHGMKAGLGRSADAANHALMEVTENFAAQGGRAAAMSAGLDVSADASALSGGHGVFAFRVSGSGIGIEKKFGSRLYIFDFRRVAASEVKVIK